MVVLDLGMWVGMMIWRFIDKGGGVGGLYIGR